MEKIKSDELPHVDFFVSRELREQIEGKDKALDVSMALEWDYDHMLNQFREEYKIIADLYSQITGNNKYAVLSAHGDDENGKWVFYDDRTRPVQGWINSVSGKYSLLMLMVCNPGQYVPASRKSLILFSNDIYSPFRRTATDYNIELSVPKKGVVDSYGLDHLIEELKSQLK